MNPIGIHALVWVDGWSEAEARHAIEETRAAGFDLLEIPLLDPATVDANLTRRLLDAAGIQASCSLGLPFDADVSSPDRETAQRGEELLAAAIDVTAALGASYLGGVTHSAMGKYLEPPSREGRRNCAEALRRLAERAARHGVSIGLEAVNRYESNLVNTAEQALALAEEVGAPNVVVHLDSYHMNIEESDVAAAIRACGDRLGYVHVGESNRGPLGGGTVDFDAFFGALAEAGYAGPIVFESFSSAVVSPAITSALAIWRNTWTDGPEVARAARSFIDRQLSAATKA